VPRLHTGDREQGGRRGQEKPSVASSPGKGWTPRSGWRCDENGSEDVALAL